MEPASHSINRRVDEKKCGTHTQRNFSKKNENMTFTEKWMELESMLSEKRKRKKQVLPVFSHTRILDFNVCVGAHIECEGQELTLGLFLRGFPLIFF